MRPHLRTNVLECQRPNFFGPATRLKICSQNSMKRFSYLENVEYCQDKINRLRSRYVTSLQVILSLTNIWTIICLLRIYWPTTSQRSCFISYSSQEDIFTFYLRASLLNVYVVRSCETGMEYVE